VKVNESTAKVDVDSFFLRRPQALALQIVLHHIESYPADAALWLDATGNLAPAHFATFASRSVRYRSIFSISPCPWR
jgi:hypothetical protein